MNSAPGALILSAVWLAVLGGCLPKLPPDATTDADGDGVHASLDCDDQDPEVGSGDPWYRDADDDSFGDLANPAADAVCPGASGSDGYVPDSTDCDDGDGTIHPGATEVWYDGTDQDCDGHDDDQDYDGSVAVEVGGDDCDDTDPSVKPGAAEVWYDGVDQDCDGNDCDQDADGYCISEYAFAIPEAYFPGDCDDTSEAVNPGAVEVCDEVDNDCDALTDVNAVDATEWYSDTDGDGFGDASVTQSACQAPADHVADDTDCDDTTATVYPGAPEVCDDLDNACNGSADDLTGLWFADEDSDGFGDPGNTDIHCAAPADFVGDDTDCDDGDPSVHPEADEFCDSIDSDCDGAVAEDDSSDAPLWYADADADGYGDASVATASCSEPAGSVPDPSDCDDTDATIRPGGDEYCNGIDDDCDGNADEDALDASTWYADSDGDGSGDMAVVMQSCDTPPGYVAVGGDCDDSDGAVSDELPLLFSDDFESGTSGGAVSADWTCFGSYCSAYYTGMASRGLRGVGTDGWGDGIGRTSSDFTDDFTLVQSFYDEGSTNDAFLVELGTSASSVAAWAGFDTNLDASQYIAGNGSTRLPLGARSIGWHRLRVEVDYTTTTTGNVTFTLDSAGSAVVSFSSYMSAFWFDDTDAYGPGAYIDDVVAWEGTGACVPSDQLTWYTDADGDGYGEPGTDVLAETEPAGASENSGDCDDGEPLAWTDAAEVCEDGVDQDCDGELDGCGFLGEYSSGYADGTVNGYPNHWSFVGAPGDVNGDGALDLALSGSGSAGLFVGPFSEDSLGAADAAVTWTGGSWGATGAVVVIASDLDGDGCDDIVINDKQASPPSAHVVYGCSYGSGAQTLPADGDATITQAGSYIFSETLAVTPDADGDGRGELFLGDMWGGGIDVGQVYGIAGGSVADGDVDSIATVTINGNAGDAFGSTIASVGDTNGDGVPELAVGAYQSGGYGRVSLFAADATGTLTPADADRYVVGVSGDNLVRDSGQTPMAGAGDVDGDGYDDILFGNSSGTLAARAAYLFRGPLAGGTDSTAADTTFHSVASGARNFAASVAAAGDADGDGLADVAISDFGETVDSNAYAGRIYVFTGIGAGTITTATAAGIWSGGGSNSDLGWALASGDLDADGYQDLIASSEGTSYSTFLLFGGEW